MDLGHLIFNSSSSSSLASHKRSSDMLFIRTADNSTAAASSNIFQGESGGRTALKMDELIGFGGVNRRPFFITPAELMLEDEYFDEQLLPEKKRRLSQEHVELLEQSFEAENKLEPEKKIELARKLGLRPRQVAVWFQNRRARWKSKKLECDFDRLKSSYDSLLADHDSLVADNQLLRSEVVALMEKLQSKNTTDGDHHHLNKLNGTTNNVESVTVTFLPKVEEDRPSTGSGGSVVVDEEGLHLVVENSKTYYPLPENGSFNDYYDYIFQSSEDDGSDNGGGGKGGAIDRVQISDSTAVMEQNHDHRQEETSYFGWSMMWS